MTIAFQSVKQRVEDPGEGLDVVIVLVSASFSLGIPKRVRRRKESAHPAKIDEAEEGFPVGL